MGEEVSLARKEAARWAVLLARAGISRVEQKASCGDKRQDKNLVAKRTAAREIINTAAQSKSNAEAKGRDGEQSPGCREDNSSGQPARSLEGRDRTSGRSAKVLGIVWPDGRCEESPTGAHWMVAGTSIATGSIFQCKHCHAVKWLPNTMVDAEKFTILIRKHGYLEGYRIMLDLHPAARNLLAKIQDINYLRRSLSNEQLAIVVAAVMTDKEYPYEEE